MPERGAKEKKAEMIAIATELRKVVRALRGIRLPRSLKRFTRIWLSFGFRKLLCQERALQQVYSRGNVYFEESEWRTFSYLFRGENSSLSALKAAFVKRVKEAECRDVSAAAFYLYGIPSTERELKSFVSALEVWVGFVEQRAEGF